MQRTSTRIAKNTGHDQPGDLSTCQHYCSFSARASELLGRGGCRPAPGAEAVRGILGHDAAVAAQDLAQPREPLRGDALDPESAGRVVLPPDDRVRCVLLRHDPPGKS
jgi:hypothetical protein